MPLRGLTRYAASGSEPRLACGHPGRLAGYVRYGANHLLPARPPTVCSAICAGIRRSLTRTHTGRHFGCYSGRGHERAAARRQRGSGFAISRSIESVIRLADFAGGRRGCSRSSEIAGALPVTPSRCNTGSYCGSKPFIRPYHARLGNGEDFGYPGAGSGVRPERVCDA